MKALTALLVLAALATAGRSQSRWTPPAVPGVEFAQRIGNPLPLDTAWRDETGARVRLADFFSGKPVVLMFGYSRCPELCSVLANGTVETLRGVSATAGDHYEVVYLSIDPTDTARDLAGLKRRDLGRYGRGTVDGWHYLSGDAVTIDRAADAAGFRFTFDPRSKLYAHASGFIIATADGRIARYFFGIDFSAKEVATALERAASGKTGEPTFDLLLACARGLGITGRYGALIWGALTASVLLTVAVVFGGIGWMLYTERRRNPKGEAAP